MNTKLDKSDYLILAIFYFISVVINVFDYYKEKQDLIEYLLDIPAYVITSFSGVLLFMYFIIPRFLIQKKSYTKFVFLGLLTIILIGTTERFVGFYSSGQDWSKFPDFSNVILYGIFNGSDSIGLALGILITKKFYESQNKIAKIEKTQKENELKLLRSQIDPHFLFNNLNTLDALIDSNAAKAKEYINRLSLIYRYLIKTKDAEVMELAKEIAFANNYIFLIKTRFGNDYEFTVEENISLQDKFIPTGALQTLLENVVKHNKSDGKKTVKTTIKINEGCITIDNVKSNIITKNESFGTGLANLKTRYQFLTDEKIKVNNSETHFEISIPIIELSN
ncbi:histidine kinase [Polaribacter sp.]|nr:histidine kinase [Polaribacter sp.]